MTSPSRKPLPPTTTEVPPSRGPKAGVMAVSLGAGGEKVNPCEMVLDCPSGLVTVTSTVAAARGGKVAESDPSGLSDTPVAGSPPTNTSAPAWNPLPETTTAVGASVDPVRGATRCANGG